MTDGFRRLLHKISAKLDERDLKSLISLCNVCESRRAEITDGMKLFEHLMQRDVISEEKINELKNLLKSLCPKRRDLVNLVNTYGGLPKEDDDCSEIGTISRRVPPEEPVQLTRPCCTLHCSCLKMSLYKVRPCYIVLLVVFVIAIVICCSFWYGDVPKISAHLRANKDLKSAGIYVLVAIIFVCFPASILCAFYGRKCFQKHREGNSEVLTQMKNVFKRKANGDAEMNICPPTSHDNLCNIVNEEVPAPNPSDTGGIPRPRNYQQLDDE